MFVDPALHEFQIFGLVPEDEFSFMITLGFTAGGLLFVGIMGIGLCTFTGGLTLSSLDLSSVIIFNRLLF